MASQSTALVASEPPSTALVTLMDKWGVTETELVVIKRQICPGASNSELVVFMNMAAVCSLNPFVKPPLIWAYKRSDKPDEKLIIDLSIDGLRLVANRHKDYEGQTPPQWCGPDEVWRNLWLSNENPVAARVGVYRKGYREAQIGIAYGREAPLTKEGRLFPIWKARFCYMLAKNAERQALKRTFQQDNMNNLTRAAYAADKGEVLEPNAEAKQWAADRRRDQALNDTPKAAGVFMAESEEGEPDEWLEQFAMAADDERQIDPETGEILNGNPAQASVPLDESIPMPPAAAPIEALPPEAYWRGRWNLCRDHVDVDRYWADMRNSVKSGKCPTEVWNKLRKELGPKAST